MTGRPPRRGSFGVVRAPFQRALGDERSVQARVVQGAVSLRTAIFFGMKPERVLLNGSVVMAQMRDLVLNDARPEIEVHTETYELRVDGKKLICEPAETLPTAQRYFLFWPLPA